MSFREEAVLDIAKKAYQHMGYNVENLIKNSDLYEREGKNQHAFCVSMDRKEDVRTLNNITPSARWMDTVLHEFGHGLERLERIARGPDRGDNLGLSDDSLARHSRLLWVEYSGIHGLLASRRLTRAFNARNRAGPGRISVAVRGAGFFEVLGLDLDRGMRDPEALHEEVSDFPQERSVFDTLLRDDVARE